MCVYISKYLLCLSPSHQALFKGTTLLKGDKENRMGLSSCRFQQYYGSIASDRMLRRQSPQGLKGAVYLLIHLFIRVCLFINMRSSMLSTGGRGIISNTIYPYWIVQVPQIGEQRSSRCIIKSQQQWFLRSHHPKNFHHRPQRLQLLPVLSARCATSLRWLWI